LCVSRAFERISRVYIIAMEALGKGVGIDCSVTPSFFCHTEPVARLNGTGRKCVADSNEQEVSFTIVYPSIDSG